jgi:hypothetical protein
MVVPPSKWLECRMARLVYACRFEVPSKRGLAHVLASYRDWLAHHYRKRRRIDGFSFDPAQTIEAEGVPGGHALSSMVYEAEPGKAVRIRWSFPDDSDVGLRWSNDVRVGQFEDRCSVEHLISIESVEYNVAPARLLFGSPRVVREICARTPT